MRLAYVIASLSGVELQALGRSLGVIFIRKKIQDLPDIHGKPALEFPVDQHKDPTKLLPADYLRGFAADLRKSLLAKYHSEQLVDVAISNWLFAFVVEGGWKELREGAKLGEVFRYLLKSLNYVVLSDIQKTKRKKYDFGPSIDNTDEEGNPTMQMGDPESEANFYHNLPTSVLPKVRQALQHVHPDAPLYLDLLMEGYTPAEILGFKAHAQTEDVMLPHLKAEGLKAPYKSWKAIYEPKIKTVLMKFVHEERTMTV
jgi:hypothetical protein